MTRNEFHTFSQSFRVELRNGEGRSFKVGRSFFYAFRTSNGTLSFSPLVCGERQWAGYMPFADGATKTHRKIMLGMLKTHCPAPVPLPR